MAPSTARRRERTKGINGRPSRNRWTRAEPTITPSATRATRAAPAGVEMPNPTATGAGDRRRTSRTKASNPGGRAARTPVTPVRDTAYNNPRVRAAIRDRRSRLRLPPRPARSTAGRSSRA